MDPWNPTQYDKFRREREQPFHDLLALIRPFPSMSIVDLGCGTGRLTRLLHEALGARQTVGIDQSARMLETARRDPLPAGLRFELGTIESSLPNGAYDLVFSNAAFHWVTDHTALVARLVRALKPGGQLAFQVPAMHTNPSHVVADRLTSAEPFREAFGGWRRPQPILEPDQYSRLLFKAGIPDPNVRLIIYPHVLAGRDEVVEWMKGTLLTEYEKHLSPDRYEEFLTAYRDRLLPELEDARPFFFPFRRILCWGRRPAQDQD